MKLSITQVWVSGITFIVTGACLDRLDGTISDSRTNISLTVAVFCFCLTVIGALNKRRAS